MAAFKDSKDHVALQSADDIDIHHVEHVRTESEMSEPPYAEHGAPIDRSPTADLRVKKAGQGLMWPRIRRSLRDPFSEFLGTFILIMFGDGVVAQVVLSNGEKGNYQSISWGWGLGVMLGVYTGGTARKSPSYRPFTDLLTGISGAHLNPAVTFANCVFRKFP